MLATVALSLCLASERPSSVHIRNFDKVNDHIYRGGEPTVDGLQQLSTMGVKTIIDLRESGQNTMFEKEHVEKLKLKYINIPIGEFSAPSNAQIAQLLSLLNNESGAVFVHCRRGKDRTGTVIACYRIQHDGWNNVRALEEAKEHGMSSLERAMRAYILHFTPLNVPGLQQPGGALAGVLK